MESMTRATWTDERLDDFARNTDRRFDEVDRRFDRVDADIRQLRSDMNAGFDRMETRLNSLHRAILQVGGGMFATFAIGFAGLLVT